MNIDHVLFLERCDVRSDKNVIKLTVFFYANANPTNLRHSKLSIGTSDVSTQHMPV